MKKRQNLKHWDSKYFSYTVKDTGTGHKVTRFTAGGIGSTTFIFPYTMRQDEIENYFYERG